jgi:hypothetical protein
MPKLHALNLQETIRNKYIMRLSTRDQLRLLNNIGKIAAIDLLFANNDRFFSFNDSDSFANCRQNLNSGNLMIEFIKKPLGKIDLKNVRPIDNCVSSDFLEKKGLEEAEEDFCLDIFAEEESFFDTENSVDFLNNHAEDKSLATKNSSGLVQSYHEVFKQLVKNVDKVANIIQQNLGKEIDKNKEMNDNYDFFLSCVLDHVKYAMEKTFQEITKTKIDQIDQLLTDFKPEPKNPTLKMFELFKKNVIFLINHGLKNEN